LAEAQEQGDSAAAALRAFPELRAASVDMVLAPVEAEIAVGERELEELQLQAAALEVRAPISGTICEIYRWPGQTVKAGEPIVTGGGGTGAVHRQLRPAGAGGAAGRGHGGHRPGPRVAHSGRRVGGRTGRTPSGTRAAAPLHDQKIQEWGQPVSIRPPEPDFRPGELIDVMFPRKIGPLPREGIEHWVAKCCHARQPAWERITPARRASAGGHSVRRREIEIRRAWQGRRVGTLPCASAGRRRLLAVGNATAKATLPRWATRKSDTFYPWHMIGKVT